MELLTPSRGLLIWQIFIFAAILLFIDALIDIVFRKTEIKEKIFYLLLTFIPATGPLLYFIMKYNLARNRKTL